MHSWKSFSALNNDVVNVAGKGPKSFTVTSQRQRVGMFDRTWFDARQVVPGWAERTMPAPATSSNTRRRSHETDANTEIGTGNAAIRKRETKKRRNEKRETDIGPGRRRRRCVGEIISKTVWFAIFNGILFGILSS